MVHMTFAEITEKYLDYLKQNRTQRYWKRQEKILRERVLPEIGDMQFQDVRAQIASRTNVIFATYRVLEWAVRHIPASDLECHL